MLFYRREHVGQPENDLGEGHHKGDGRKVHGHERQSLGGNGFQRLVCNTRCDEHVFAHGRCGEADAAAADEDDTEVNGVNAVGHHNGQEHRRDQHDDSQSFHEHAKEDQQDDDEQPHDVHVLGEGEHPFGEFVGDAVFGEDTAEAVGGEHDDEHSTGQPGGVLQSGHERLELEFAVDEAAYIILKKIMQYR